ncbi:hypothetical protein [Vibrio mediterranei]|jgi:xylose isomerase|uniref:hypothetical protein n=1 Tax=Vibrio mediterranei TaxID=689 RepID=UPI0040682A04
MSENYQGEQAKRIMKEAMSLQELATRNQKKKWNRNEASNTIEEYKPHRRISSEP